ncbi:hypothetical protein [Streptomyces sp. ME19-01-6]|uniref:hypothetical protein n=1 Tax=Streptomyces sp. ME19-01-6 TaxID=3028686 RepID=UPI0029A4C0A5|nr:hypothetical protein [Streptomyces sp. ME19-01-6]MDX3230597.1 hypothetical protein [Streptomyces sp. ME19-01-6]
MERLTAKMRRALTEERQEEERRREQERRETTTHVVTRYPTAGGADVTLLQVRTKAEVRLVAECGGCGGISGMREAREWASSHAKECKS